SLLGLRLWRGFARLARDGLGLLGLGLLAFGLLAFGLLGLGLLRLVLAFVFGHVSISIGSGFWAAWGWSGPAYTLSLRSWARPRVFPLASTTSQFRSRVAGVAT